MKLTAPQIFSLISQQFKLFMERIIGLKNAEFHNELDDVLSNSLYRKIAISFSRGHGKSSHISVAYPLWEIAKNHNVRILLISATATISRSFMTEAIGHIEKNERYKIWAQQIDPNGVGVVPQYKGKSKSNEKWAGDSIIIDRDDLNLKDPTINGVGLFGSILSKRADIIICDDIVNQENSMTEEQRLKVIDWIYTTVLPVMVPGGRFIYLGNTWHMDDLVARLMKDPQFDYRKTRAAIIHESDHPELWKNWANIILDESLEVEARKGASDAYYEENKVLMEEGVQVLWPERYSYKDLYLLRLSNSYAFERMYQCDPSNRPNQKIKDEWVAAALEKGKGLKLQNTPYNGLIVAMSCSGLDLAISEEASSDDTVLLTLDKILYSFDNIKAGDFIIRNIRRGKFSPNEVRNMIKSHYELDHPNGIRVETVGYQEAIKRDMEDMGIPITGYHTGGEKNDPDIGVNSLAVLMELGKLVLPSDPTDHETARLISQLANEMRSYPDGHTGDSLMALWFAYSEIRDRTSTQLVIPSKFLDGPKDMPDIKDTDIRQREEKKADDALIAEQNYERQVFNNMMSKRR